MKTIISIILFFTIYISAFSQDLFLRADISSNYSIFSSQFHSPLESIIGRDRMDVGEQSFSQKVAKGTYSEGMIFNLGIGKEVNNHISILLDCNYQRGSGVQDVFTNIPNFNASQFSKSKTIRIIPGILISTGNQNKVSAYMRTGLIVPIWGKVNSQTTIRDQSGQIYAMLSQEFNPNISTTLQLESETSGKLSYGLQNSIGINFQISKGLSVFTEVGLSVLNIGLQKSEVISASGNISVPGLPDTQLDIDAIPVFLKEIKYHEELSIESNAPNSYQEFNPNISLDALNYGSNFNSVGFGIGLKLKL